MTEPPTRRRLGPQERRAQLIAATGEVLAELGYQAATADAIATRAGVSKGLLWHYFSDIDALFEATAHHTLLELRRAVGARLDLAAPAPDVIRAAVRGAADLRHTHAAHRRALEAIVLNLRTADGGMRLGIKDFEDTYLEQEAIFRRGQADGDFRADLDPRVMAVTYQGAVDAMLGYLDAHPDADTAGYARTVAEILLGGMTAPSSTNAPPAAPTRTRGPSSRPPAVQGNSSRAGGSSS